MKVSHKKTDHRAIDITEHWLRVAIKIIDRNTGEGYAKEHPVTNGAIVIHTQRLKSDPGGNLLS
ncbi:hypothetical protein ACQ47W_005020 [Escherichia coli]